MQTVLLSALPLFNGSRVVCPGYEVPVPFLGIFGATDFDYISQSVLTVVCENADAAESSVLWT